MRDALLSSSGEMAFSPLLKLGKKAEHVVLQRYFRTRENSLEKQGQKETLLNSKSPYPPKLFVLQSQHSCALCEQLHLHRRKRMRCREVPLGAPAVKIRTERCSTWPAGQQHCCLDVQWWSENCPAWHKPKWLGLVARTLIIIFGKCGTDVWKTCDGSLGKKKRAFGTSMKPNLRELSYLERTVCLLQETLHGHNRNWGSRTSAPRTSVLLMPLLFSWPINPSFPDW